MRRSLIVHFATSFAVLSSACSQQSQQSPCGRADATGVQAIAAGDDHTCALMLTGGVRCWGYSANGELGDGHIAEPGNLDSLLASHRTTAPTTDVLSGVQAIALGGSHTCALTTTGGVRCWGGNAYGQLGDGTTTDRPTPPTKDVLTHVKAIATGGDHTCAVMTTGGVRCWGHNAFGQLGDGTTTSRMTPPTTDLLTDVQSLAAGSDHTCALTATGGVRCWGENAFGQLGDGTILSTTPPTTDVLTDVKAIAARSSHTCVLTTTGGVRCWGDNSNGQLGDGTTTDRQTPPTTDVLTDVNAVVTGQFHTCALMTSGGVRCWGENSNGQWGDGTTASISYTRLTPPNSDALTGVQSIATGFAHICGVMSAGDVRCWGMNDYGQLGDGSTTERLTPTPVVETCN